MAIRFNSSFDVVRNSTSFSLGTTSQLSVACWVKISVNQGAESDAWTVRPGASAHVSLGTGTDGVSMGVRLGSSNTQRSSRTMTVGTWYFFGTALSFSGNSGRMVSRTESESEFDVQTWFENALTSVSMNFVSVGANSATNPLNGCVAHLKMWKAALSQSELEDEATQGAPVRTADLVAYWSFDNTSGTDDSGNGHDLDTSGISVEDGPSFETVKPLADSGSGAEALAADATVAPADTASASETLTVTQSLALADTGAASDEPAATATAALADTGGGVTALGVGQPIAVADSGAAADAFAASAALSLADTGTAAAVLSPAQATVALADTAAAAGTAVGSLTLFKDLADAGTGADALLAHVERVIGRARRPRHTWTAGRPRRRPR